MPFRPKRASVRSSTASRSALPGLKCGTRFSGIATLSPERGLRPIRGGRRLTEKLPKPRTSILWPRTSASLTASRMAFTANSASRCVSWPNLLASSSTRSLRVMRSESKSESSRFAGTAAKLAVLLWPLGAAKRSGLLAVGVVHLGAQQGAQVGQAGAFFGRLLAK